MVKDIITAVGAVLIIFAVTCGFVYLAETPRTHYVHIACVDPFTKQMFETDRTVTRVEVWDRAYALHRQDGTLTMVPRTDNIMCSLSTEYPAHVVAN